MNLLVYVEWLYNTNGGGSGRWLMKGTTLIFLASTIVAFWGYDINSGLNNRRSATDHCVGIPNEFLSTASYGKRELHIL